MRRFLIVGVDFSAKYPSEWHRWNQSGRVLPSHLASSSYVMGSSLGGASSTGFLGANRFDSVSSAIVCGVALKCEVICVY